jgi:hypothetical protein
MLDIYDHYAWRYWLARFPDQFGKPLEENDTWQERYILGAGVNSPELRFWLSAATGGVMGASPRGAASRNTPRRTKTREGRRASGGRKKARVKPSAKKRTARKTRKSSARKKVRNKKAHWLA